MSKRMHNLLAGLIVLVFISGCSVFPNTTTVSASSKANNINNPTVKVNQTFKWSKSE